MKFSLPFFRKSVPVRSPEDQAAVARENPTGLQRGSWFRLGVPLISQETQFQAAQALRHPVVYRCVNKIAEAFASIELKARKKRDDDAPPLSRMDATTRQLNAVLQAPTDDFSDYHVRYWMAANFAVYGCAPVKISRTFDGLANAIYPLRNVMAQAVGDKAGRIIAYKFMSGDGPQFELPTREFVEARERSGANSREAWAACLAKPGLDILSLDNSPIQAASLPIEVFTLLMQRARETASGHPNKRTLISTSQQPTKEQEDALYEMFQESRVGGERSGLVGFISGDGVEVIPIDSDFSDIHSKMPSDDMARQIAGIFGVPAQLLGLGGADAAKYAANFVEGRTAFYEDTIIPGYVTPLCRALTRAICPPGYEVYADLDSVEAIRDARMRRMQAAVPVTFLSVNEKRKFFGFEKAPEGEDVPAGDKIAATTPPPAAPAKPELGETDDPSSGK